MTEPRLARRAGASDWVADQAGLADAVAVWEAEVGEARGRLPEAAAESARPGVTSPARIARHAVAVGVSRLLRVPRLPGDLRDAAAGRDVREIALESAIEGFVDQLALGGPASAEVARIIEGSGVLFPSALRTELARRSIRPMPLDADEAERIAVRQLGPLSFVSDLPLAALPVSEVFPAVLGGQGPANVRVRRPGVAADLQSDAALSAAFAAAVQRVVPQVGGMHPLGFVELIARLGVESTDLRFEALGSVELGLILEQARAEHAAADGMGPAMLDLEVARPIAGAAGERAMATEQVLGVPFAQFGGQLADPPSALAGLMAVTLESAVLHGAFWADLDPGHLVVRAGGHLTLVGCGTIGHLSPDLRRAGITFLKALFSGDAAGQVEAMQIAGAVSADTDLDGLVDDLSRSDALKVTTILMGGETALLGALSEAVRLLLEHRIRPPIEVVLLLRSVFALGALADRIVPEGNGLMVALMGLVPRLPDLLARAADGREG